jgi:HlyD family secretion protein
LGYRRCPSHTSTDLFSSYVRIAPADTFDKGDDRRAVVTRLATAPTRALQSKADRKALYVSDTYGGGDEVNSEADGKENDELVRENLEPTLPRARMSLSRLPSPGPSMRRLSASMTTTRVAALIILVVLLAGLLAILIRNIPPSLHYATAKVGNLTIGFPTTGILQSAVYGANFAVGGRLAELDVTIGEQVTQGELLAKLDTTLLSAAVKTASANVSAAEVQLSNAEALQSAVNEQTSAQLAAALDKEQTAITACGSNESCIQSAEATYSAAQATAASQNQVAQSAVSAASSSVSAAEAALHQAEVALDGATLTAGHDGTVSSITGAVGDTVGGPGTTFIQLVDLSQIQVKATANVAQVGGISSTTVFRLTVPAAGKAQFGGTLEGVSPVGQQVNGVLTYPVLIDVDMQSTNGANLLPGMTANVQVITQQRTGVLLIPASAVSFAQAAGNAQMGGFLKHSQVVKAQHEAEQLLLELESSNSVSPADNPTPSYVLNYANGQWKVLPVVLGLTDGHVYEVLAGLTVGQRVVTGQASGDIIVPTPTAPVTS